MKLSTYLLHKPTVKDEFERLKKRQILYQCELKEHGHYKLVAIPFQ